MPFDHTQPVTPETVFDLPAAELSQALSRAANRNPVLNEVLTECMRRKMPFIEGVTRCTIALADGMNQMAMEMAEMAGDVEVADGLSRSEVKRIITGDDHG